MNGNAGPIATLFGIGRAPYAPGTAASIVALPLAWAIYWFFGQWVLLALALFVALLGIWAGEEYAKETGVADPSEVVIDELAGQFLACALAPLTLAGFVLAFFLFRLFDMVKPWPVSKAETLPGGAGIMADDIVAGLIAGLLVTGATRLGLV